MNTFNAHCLCPAHLRGASQRDDDFGGMQRTFLRCLTGND
jgi:hypothetical protein